MTLTNPALAELSVLLGRWRLEISNAEFLPDGETGLGTMEVSTLDDAFVVIRSAADIEGPPRAVSVVGRNEDRDDYTVLYSDDRGVSRIYAMTFAGGTWTQHREDPGFHQHFEGTLDPGGDRITAEWTRSHDGGATWIHDFDLTYTRL